MQIMTALLTFLNTYGSNPNIDEGVEHVTGGVISGNLALSHPVRAGLDHGLCYTVETTDDLKFGVFMDKYRSHCKRYQYKHCFRSNYAFSFFNK